MSSSIDLYAQISEAHQHKKNADGRVNGVVQLLDDMGETDRQSLLKALHDPTIDGTVIHEILNKNGWDISYDQVRRFRNGSVKIPDRYRPTEG